MACGFSALPDVFWNIIQTYIEHHMLMMPPPFDPTATDVRKISPLQNSKGCRIALGRIMGEHPRVT